MGDQYAKSYINKKGGNILTPSKEHEVDPKHQTANKEKGLMVNTNVCQCGQGPIGVERGDASYGNGGERS